MYDEQGNVIFAPSSPEEEEGERMCDAPEKIDSIFPDEDIFFNYHNINSVNDYDDDEETPVDFRDSPHLFGRHVRINSDYELEKYFTTPPESQNIDETAPKSSVTTNNGMRSLQLPRNVINFQHPELIAPVDKEDGGGEDGIITNNDVTKNAHKKTNFQQSNKNAVVVATESATKDILVSTERSSPTPTKEKEKMELAEKGPKKKKEEEEKKKFVFESALSNALGNNDIGVNLESSSSSSDANESPSESVTINMNDDDEEEEEEEDEEEKETPASFELTNNQEETTGLDSYFNTSSAFSTLNTAFSSKSKQKQGESEEEEENEKETDEICIISDNDVEDSSETGYEVEEEEEEEMDTVIPSVFPVSKPVERLPPKQELEDPTNIYRRLRDTYVVCNAAIASILREYLHIPESEPDDSILKKYVGTEETSHSPLYTNQKFWHLFVTSVIMYACQRALQDIQQKSDNQKISKSKHPLLVNTQRTDIWKQFWGTTMPDRGQSLEELQAKYQTELPILRIWHFFKQNTMKDNPKNPVGVRTPKQWCNPLLSSMMFSARFRYAPGKVPRVSLNEKQFDDSNGSSIDKRTMELLKDFEPNTNYYCALTGTALKAGQEAYLCSFLCEVSSDVVVNDDNDVNNDNDLSTATSTHYSLSEGLNKKKKKRGRKADPVIETVHTIQEIGCIIRKTVPGKEIDPKTNRPKNIDSEPLIKTIRAISEFDKTIADWVQSWVNKHAVKLPNMKRDTVAYAMTGDQALSEISQWYITFQVMVAMTRHAICGVDANE